MNWILRDRQNLAIPILATLCLGSTVPLMASDWPQFLGPTRNGVGVESQLAAKWPVEGPAQLWQRKVGEGFSGPVVLDERLILFHRQADRAVVECLEKRTGKVLWKNDYPTDYRDDFGFDEGPRSTPSIANGRVFTYGAEGQLACWKLTNGELLWKINTFEQFSAAKGFFGRASSPLVEGSKVILNLGGKDGAGIVAFDAVTGKVIWQSTSDDVSYSSPIAANLEGQRVLFSLTREALVALSPENGRIYDRYPWRPRVNASVSAATPLVVGSHVFISACYGADATLLQYRENKFKEIWSKPGVLSNHYATSAHYQGFLYGWHGRQEQGCELRCVELKTGTVRWSEPGLKAGTITLAGHELLVLTEQGLLLRVPADPDGYKPVARAQILPFGARSYPAISDGLWFARSQDRLVCCDLGSP